jgi:hypothetical protein
MASSVLLLEVARKLGSRGLRRFRAEPPSQNGLSQSMRESKDPEVRSRHFPDPASMNP